MPSMVKYYPLKNIAHNDVFESENKKCVPWFESQVLDLFSALRQILYRTGYNEIRMNFIHAWILIIVLLEIEVVFKMS